MVARATNWIDFYISIGAFAETVIWACVAAFAILVFRIPANKLLEAFVERVKRGDDVATPWFSFASRESHEKEIVKAVADNIRSEIVASVDDEKLGTFDVEKIEKAISSVTNKFITVTFPFQYFQNSVERDLIIDIYMKNWGIVSEFLNDIWFSARDSGIDIPIWTYGSYWILKNVRTGETISKSPGNRNIDSRDFTVLGIKPGDQLLAERIVAD